MELVVGDAMEIADVLGYAERRFYLVGHDWGASLAWEIAARYPERLASLTILSCPHPPDAIAKHIAVVGIQRLWTPRLPRIVPAAPIIHWSDGSRFLHSTFGA